MTLTERDIVSQVEDESRAKIETVLNWPESESKSFEEIYPSIGGGGRLQRKFELAKALIQDGRYPHQLMLAKNLIPFDVEAIPEALEMRRALYLELMKKGIISFGSKEANEVKILLENQVDKEGDIRDLFRMGVPIEVLGQIQTIELFENITDSQKLEELRSWVTDAMIRPWLGVLTGERPLPDADAEIVDIMDRIPKKVFRNSYTLKYNLVQVYFENKFMSIITNRGFERGVGTIGEAIESRVRDDEEKGFYGRILNRFRGIAASPDPETIKTRILVKGKERTFPSCEQKAFCYDFENNGCRLVVAEPGLGKTGMAYYTLEKTDAQKVIVFVPAGGRQTWQIEQDVVFKDSDDIFTVWKSRDLDDPRILGKKYIVVSHELLGDTASNPELMDKLYEVLINRVKAEGGIIDEIGNLTNPETVEVEALRKLVDGLRKNYLARARKQDAPIIGLTATPIKGHLSDMNVMMGILYPNQYAATTKEATENRKTFSDTYLNRPDLVYLALAGGRKMFRWESAAGVQELKCKVVPVTLSPFERLLCDFIADMGTDALSKIRFLENAVLNPLLVKAEVREIDANRIPSLDLDSALEVLKKIVSEWKLAKGIDKPRGIEDYLSVDKLVELGFRDLVLAGFFSKALENGLDTLVEGLTKGMTDPGLIDLRNFWLSRELSTKYEVLKCLVVDSLTWRIDKEGNVVRDKALVVSPSQRQGRTGDVLQREIESSEGLSENLYASYELDRLNDLKLINLIREWVAGLCNSDEVLVIDGTLGTGKKKEAVIAKWVNRPECAVMLATLEATYQSRDYTLSRLVDGQGRKIVGVHKVYLGWTWHWERFKQMAGRSARQGQLVPVRNTVLQALDHSDVGKGENVRYTYLLSRIALSGATLKLDDKQFFDSKRSSRRIIERSTESQYLYRSFGNLVGRGEEYVREFMAQTSSIDKSKTNAQKIAERYFDNGQDEYKTVGHNAELVAKVIRSRKEGHPRTLSVGAGTLLLQRALRQGIDNVDINEHIMNAGWNIASRYGGRRIVASGSSLPEQDCPAGSYDVVDMSFVLHWSKLNGASKETAVDHSERVKILKQATNVLRRGGDLILTFPKEKLDRERFNLLTSTLEKSFGLKIDYSLSGESYGVTGMGLRKRLGWCIVGTKVVEPDTVGLALSDLEFTSDNRHYVSVHTNGKGSEGATQHLPNGSLESPESFGFKFDKYQIVDPNKAVANDVGFVSKNGDRGKEFLQETVYLDFLRGTTEEEFREYKQDLVRDVSRITGWGWERIESFAREVIHKKVKEGKRLAERKVAFSWVLKEAKRCSKN